MTLSPKIRALCVEYFGRHVTRGGRTQLVGNRCDACPARQPCLAFGAAPARTFEELDEARRAFVGTVEAMKIDGYGGSGL